MPLNIVTVPCLSDNYAFLVHDEPSGRTALVDAPEAGPIGDELARRGWQLSHILITHHHGDHIAGVDALRAGATVIGNAADAARLPPLDLPVSDGDSFDFAGHAVRVIDVPGHTVGHIAFHIPDANAVFTADSLMALGCGRLFEGTAEQMWASLSKLAALPDDTLVCSGHEYTAATARVALTIDRGNPDLQDRATATAAAHPGARPALPPTLALEEATNPFLRAALPDVKAAIDMPQASDVEAFAEIRRRKDQF